MRGESVNAMIVAITPLNLSTAFDCVTILFSIFTTEWCERDSIKSKQLKGMLKTGSIVEIIIFTYF